MGTRMLEFDPARFQRALQQTMYLVGMDSENMVFNVLGTTGTVYEVNWDCIKNVTCTCIDFRKRGGHPCKHIFFCIGRIGGFRLHQVKTFMLSRNLMRVMKEITKKIKSRAEQIQGGEVIGNGDDCTICLETLEKQKRNCHACSSCQNQFHYECWQLWLKRCDTCPLCRVQVPKAKKENIILLSTENIV